MARRTRARLGALCAASVAASSTIPAASLAASLAAPAFTSTFRPPAVPLAVSSPFVSIWSFDAASLASQTTFWNGPPNTLDSLVRVDGTTYGLLGNPPAGVKPCTQLGLPAVTATTSRYAFSCGGASVTMRFTTPQLPDDFETLARPATHIEWSAASQDGKAHAVQVYYDHSAEVVTNDPARVIEWDRPTIPAASGGATGNLLALRMGQVGQTQPGFNYTARLHNSTEPRQQMDYGFVYLLVDDVSPGAAPATSVIAANTDAQAAFVKSGALPGASGDAQPPAPVADPALVVSAVAWDLGSVQAGAPATCRATFFVDAVVEVLWYSTLLPPNWRRNYTTDSTVVPSAPLADTVATASAVLAAADAFDASVAAATLAAGGSNYSAVAQLTYRQVFGAHGYAWNGSYAWIFQKEISSDGDMSTLDVIFPASPQGLVFNDGDILSRLIEPAHVIMGPNSPVKFNADCAFHSMGKWPIVDEGNGGCGMPMESTGDILLMTAAVVQARNGSLPAGWGEGGYLETVRRLAAYCASPANLPFPPPQDMTDDFSHAPGNLTNLALKCIIGIGAAGYLEAAAGNTSGAKLWYAAATAAGQTFAQLAPSTTPAPHLKFIYNSTPAVWETSSGLMYNAFYARLLGLEFLVPGFTDLFNAHFAFLANSTANNTWCPPLSSIEHDGKWDWSVFTAALQYTTGGGSGGGRPQPSAWSTSIFDQLAFFANHTSSRFPLTDHPECTGPYPPAAAADRARPVLGAFYAPVLIAAPPPAFVDQHAAIRAFVREHLGVDAEAVAGMPFPYWQ